ncbi:hypothetical protein A3749_10805 [Oleiphilus sp. HI0078]|nr:hypothetical protein A3749_10805 [Oleiphilus sp. HI0078]
MIIVNSLLTLFILLAITACGGSENSDGGSASPDNSEEHDLLLPGNYSSSSVSTAYYKLIMPTDGKVDFAARGAQITIRRMNQNIVFSFDRESNGGVRALEAGEYIIEFDFWNRRVRQVSVYSPALLNHNDLPELTNKTYESSTKKAEYFKLSLPADGPINFSTTGTIVTIFDTNLNTIGAQRYDYEATAFSDYLPAGNYIVKLHFWGLRTKSTTVVSPVLE